MSVDAISAFIRALSFIALFQAAGVAIFVVIFGRRLQQATRPIRALGFASASAAVVLVFGHYALEAARMAGAMSGAFDMSLQRVVLDSSMSTAWGMRTAGLLMLAIAIGRDELLWDVLSIAGAALAIAAFLFVGHTSTHSGRVWLAALLSVHLAVVAFWFGSLLPLHVVSRREDAGVAADLIDQFSRIAIWLVPGIFVAGLVLAVVLVSRWAVLGEGYGLLLLAKVTAFAALMMLAALNKWRYGPALRTSPGAASLFQRALTIEYVVICAVLSATAVMTTFFSPET